MLKFPFICFLILFSFLCKSLQNIIKNNNSLRLSQEPIYKRKISPSIYNRIKIQVPFQGLEKEKSAKSKLITVTSVKIYLWQ